MAGIRLTPGADREQVLAAVQETFETRDYHWERIDDEIAQASEGGQRISEAARPTSKLLCVRIDFYTGKDKLVLTQQTRAAAYSSAGAGYYSFQLGSRFRQIVTAVRADLTAAALTRR